MAVVAVVTAVVTTEVTAMVVTLTNLEFLKGAKRHIC